TVASTRGGMTLLYGKKGEATTLCRVCASHDSIQEGTSMTDAPTPDGPAGDPDFANYPIDADGAYINDDMAPVPLKDRKWGLRDLAARWISMSACIPTYMLASSLIAEGMDWRQAVATIFLGNLIVLVPMVLNAHAGTKYGIPFPVYCRASFGIRGANVPALAR